MSEATKHLSVAPNQLQALITTPRALLRSLPTSCCKSLKRSSTRCQMYSRSNNDGTEETLQVSAEKVPTIAAGKQPKQSWKQRQSFTTNEPPFNETKLNPPEPEPAPNVDHKGVKSSVCLFQCLLAAVYLVQIATHRVK